jgi:hypothetical protein
MVSHVRLHPNIFLRNDSRLFLFSHFQQSDIWSTNEYETRILKSYFCKAVSHDHTTLSTICVLLLRQSSNQVIIKHHTH